MTAPAMTTPEPTASTLHHFDNTYCPKCQANFYTPFMHYLGDGRHELVYACPDCKATYALVPVTQFYLSEISVSQDGEN